MDEKTAAKVNTLLEDVYAAGIKEGRELARQDMVRMLSGEPRVQRAKRAAVEPASNGAKPPSAPTAQHTLDEPIEQALLNLADEHPDGIFPDAIADYIKRNGADVSVALIRQTLRQMTLQGKARRLPRGRYAAIDRAPPPGTLFHTAPPMPAA